MNAIEALTVRAYAHAGYTVDEVLADPHLMRSRSALVARLLASRLDIEDCRVAEAPSPYNEEVHNVAYALANMHGREPLW